MNIITLRKAVRAGSVKALKTELAGERISAKHAKSDLLELAIHTNKPPILEMLLAAGLDVNYCHKQVPPLHVACAAARTAAVEVLIAHGADVNAKGKEGRRPLHEAVSGGPEKIRSKIVKALLAAGANCNAIDDFRYTPLHQAATLASLDTIQLLIDAGTDIHRKDTFGENAIETADRDCNPQIVALLKKYDRQPNNTTR
jgi:ankyrin repeat protein